MWSVHGFRIIARASTPKTGRSRWPAPSTLTHLAKPLPRDSRRGSTSHQSAMHRNNIIPRKPVRHEEVGQGLAICSHVPEVPRDVNQTFNHREKSEDVIMRRYEQLESATSERTDEHRKATRIFLLFRTLFPFLLFFLLLSSMTFRVCKPQTFPKTCHHRVHVHPWCRA